MVEAAATGQGLSTKKNTHTQRHTKCINTSAKPHIHGGKIDLQLNLPCNMERKVNLSRNRSKCLFLKSGDLKKSICAESDTAVSAVVCFCKVEHYPSYSQSQRMLWVPLYPFFFSVFQCLKSAADRLLTSKMRQVKTH